MFPSKVQRNLRNYVYRLIDPRNGDTFYVGRGKGNRVFDHVNDKRVLSPVAPQEGQEDQLSEKLAPIREIRSRGLEVIHIIHRHGMSEEEARLVESALIDVYPGLTNQMRGHDADRGPANASQLIRKFSANPIKFDKSHKLLIVKINQSTINERGSIYEAARYAWRLRKDRAEKACFVLASLNGVCEDVFIADDWQEMHDRRYGFTGKQAAAKVHDHYVGKIFTDNGAKSTNPIRYINC